MPKRVPWIVSAVVLLVCAMALPTAVYGQFGQSTGGIFGKVVDEQGGVLPGVSVIVKGPGAPITVYSDARGEFRVTNIDAGNYTLTVSLQGFSTVNRENVTVQVGNWGDIFAGAQTPIAQEPANQKFFSEFVKEPFPKKAIDIIGHFMRNAPTEESNYFVDAFGGAIKREPRGGTAFVHRDALFYGEIGAAWAHEDGKGFGLKLDFLPLDPNAEIVLREPLPKAEAEPAEEATNA